VIPSSSHRRAKCEFSLRKPYPGWIASHPQSRAIRSVCSMSRYAAAPRPRNARASSTFRVCNESASSSEKIATVRIPISAAVRAIRIAISARLAISRQLGIMLVNYDATIRPAEAHENASRATPREHIASPIVSIIGRAQLVRRSATANRVGRSVVMGFSLSRSWPVLCRAQSF
jgi:hypothetical protein